MQKHEETRAKFFTDKLPSRLRLSISQSDVPTFPGRYVPGQKVLTSQINQLHHCYVWFWPHILAQVYSFTLLTMRPRPTVSNRLKVLMNMSQWGSYCVNMTRQWPKGQVASQDDKFSESCEMIWCDIVRTDILKIELLNSWGEVTQFSKSDRIIWAP